VSLITVIFLGLSVNTAFSKNVAKINFSKVNINSLDFGFYTSSIGYEIIFKSGWSVEGEMGALLISEEKTIKKGIVIIQLGDITLMPAPSLTIKKYIKATASSEFWCGGGMGYHIWGPFFYIIGGFKQLLGKAFTIEPFFRINYYTVTLPLEIPNRLGFGLGLSLVIR